jgi:hypothetical protein
LAEPNATTRNGRGESGEDIIVASLDEAQAKATARTDSDIHEGLFGTRVLVEIGGDNPHQTPNPHSFLKVYLVLEY